MRGLTAATAAQFTAGQLYPVVFVEVKVAPFGSPPEEYVRMWNGVGSIEWDSLNASPPDPQTWTGAIKADGDGGFTQIGTISAITETVQIRAEGVRLTLQGISPDAIAMALEDIITGYPVKVWFGALTEAGAVIADPYQSFSGRVDGVSVEVGGQSASISITCESDLIRLRIPNVRFWTHQDQQKEFPGDTGFSRVEELKDKRLNWGYPTGGAVTPSGAGAPAPSLLYQSFFGNP